MKRRKTLPIGEITFFSTIILCAIALLIEHSRNKKEEAERMKDPVYAQVVHEIEEWDRLGWLNIFPLTFVALVVIAGFGGLNWIDGGKKSGLEEWADRVNHQRAIKKVWGKEYVAQLKKKYGVAGIMATNTR